MRINGDELHALPVDGKVAQTDDRVKNVFAKWAELVAADFFVENHPAVGIHEDAPTDSFRIPVNAKNKKVARLFLAFAAKVGTQGFQEFMQNLDRIDQILARIEAQRARIYGPL